MVFLRITKENADNKKKQNLNPSQNPKMIIMITTMILMKIAITIIIMIMIVDVKENTNQSAEEITKLTTMLV